MKEIFIPLVSEEIELSFICSLLLSEIQKIHQTSPGYPGTRLGFVSGVITSDGPAHWEQNMAILDGHTRRIRAKNDFPVFSAADIFTMEHLRRIDEYRLRKNDLHGWLHFWRHILQSGRITDIYMTKRWEQSKGSRDEFYTAQRIPLTIHNPA